MDINGTLTPDWATVNYELVHGHTPLEAGKLSFYIPAMYMHTGVLPNKYGCSS